MGTVGQLTGQEQSHILHECTTKGGFRHVVFFSKQKYTRMYTYPHQAPYFVLELLASCNQGRLESTTWLLRRPFWFLPFVTALARNCFQG